MIRMSDIYIFCITVFIALIFLHPGLYLSDELAPANQLYQISQGHQLAYHEGKYGVYNDIPDKSIAGSHGVMIYPLLLPLLSIPIYSILVHATDTSRIVPLILWEFILIFLVGIIIIYYKNKISSVRYLALAIPASIILNAVFYSPIISNLEVIAITLTNVILYGLFGVYIWKFICSIFSDDNKRIFTWIAVMSSSSLLFWVGTLKDHVLVSLLFIMILYYFTKFYYINEKRYLIVVALLTGCIIWERPELSIAIAPLICLLLVYIYKEYCLAPLATYGVFTFIGLIPAMINNYIVTSSPFKFPYQAVNQTLGGYHLASSNNVIDVLLQEIPSHIVNSISTISVDNIIGIMIYPVNGGIGLLPFMILPIFTILLIPYFIWVKQIPLSSSEKILYLFSLFVVLIYTLTTAIGFTLHAETGLLPDMRYFTLIYAPLMIASISLFTRAYDMHYRDMIYKFIIWFAITLSIFTLCIIILSNGIMTMESVNLSANMISLVIFAISTAIIIDTIRTSRVGDLENCIAVMISLPLSWQIFAAMFATKFYSYEMILPLMEFIKKVMIG